MSLRWRIAIVAGGLATVAVAAAAIGSFLTTGRQLRTALDQTLTERAVEIGAGPGRAIVEANGCPPDPLLRPAAAVQIVRPDGTIAQCLPAGPLLPAIERSAAIGLVELSSVTLAGVPYRVAATPFHAGGVLQIAQSETANRSVLAVLRTRLVALTAFVAVFAALVAWVLSRRLVRPILSLRDTARQIAHDQDLTTTMPINGSGEIRDLADSFTAMVGALATSREQQRRLITDASHEMRTPLTSLTANLDLLDRFDRLPAADRPDVLAAVRADVDDLTQLMTELVDLATDRSKDEPVVPVDLADLAEGVVTRARRRTGRTITLTTEHSGTVLGRPSMLERAINNLVDNAHKYSPPESTIELHTTPTTIAVIDHGPGIPPEDRQNAFERFWRADTARNRTGSGLGLAIVHQIIDRHDGTVAITDTQGGGTTITATFPQS